MKWLALLAVAMFGCALLVGDAWVGWPDAVTLWQIRLPRAVLGALIGAGLGASGAVLQGALRNPLADPGLLGITGAAGLGAVIVFYWGVSRVFPPALRWAGWRARRSGAWPCSG